MLARFLSVALLVVLPIQPGNVAFAQNVEKAPATGGEVLGGYSKETSGAERDWEQKFQQGILPDNIRENMRRLTAHPHHVGSPYDKDNAEWMLAKFKEWGFDAKIETFSVLFPTPKERLLELVAPTKFKAKLQEPALSIDPTSSQTSEQLPTYNAYSADGDVTAPLVYVNYGNREDYEELDRLGIYVKGAIVIARYGRGLARHQTESCRRAWRDRLHHLFRPGRRRLHQWRRLSEWRMASARGGAARQRDGYRLSGRSVDPRSRRHARCEALEFERSEDHHENASAADFLCGRDAAAQSR